MDFDWWNFQNLIGILFATFLILVFCVRHKARFILLYFLLLPLVQGFPQYFNREMAVDELLLSWLAMKAFATIVVVWLFVNYLTELGEVYFFRFLFLVLTADAVWQLLGGFGIFVGTTHDTTVMAAVVPLLVADEFKIRFRRTEISGVFCLLGLVWAVDMVKQFSATSFLILGFHVLFLVALYWKRWGWFLRSSVAVVFGWAASVIVMNPRFGGQRWNTTWKEHLEYWWEHSDLIFGFGPNSFQWLSILVPVHVEGNNLFWLHSDWLQIMIEYGIIGAVLAVGLYFYILAKLFCHKNQALFPTWVGLGVAMTFYSPAQFFPIQILIGILIKRGLSK